MRSFKRREELTSTMENIKVNFKLPKRQSLWIRTISFPKGPVKAKVNVLCMTDQETHFDIIRMLHSRTTDENEDDTILMDDRQNRQGNIVGTFNDLEEDKQHNIGDDDDDDDDEE